MTDTFAKNTWMIDFPANGSVLILTVTYMPVRQEASTAIFKLYDFISVFAYVT